MQLGDVSNFPLQRTTLYIITTNQLKPVHRQGSGARVFDNRPPRQPRWADPFPMDRGIYDPYDPYLDHGTGNLYYENYPPLHHRLQRPARYPHRHRPSRGRHHQEFHDFDHPNYNEFPDLYDGDDYVNRLNEMSLGDNDYASHAGSYARLRPGYPEREYSRPYQNPYDPRLDGWDEGSISGGGGGGMDRVPGIHPRDGHRTWQPDEYNPLSGDTGSSY